MPQEMFDRWHAGEYFSNDPLHPKTWIERSMFSELDSESGILNKLLEDHNPWEAYYRLNSWLHALNKFVTWYHGEVGTRRSDVDTQEPTVRFLRWIGENRSLISQTMAGIGAEYYSITESPSGILLTVSFRPPAQGNALSQPINRACETTSHPADRTPIAVQHSGSRPAAPAGIGPTHGPLSPGFPPNDMRSNTFNPNNAAYTATQINRANQMNPNNRAYKSSRKRE